MTTAADGTTTDGVRTDSIATAVREWIDAWGAEVASVRLGDGKRRMDDGLVAFGTHAFAVSGLDRGARRAVVAGVAHHRGLPVPDRAPHRAGLPRRLAGSGDRAVVVDRHRRGRLPASTDPGGRRSCWHATPPRRRGAAPTPTSRSPRACPTARTVRGPPAPDGAAMSELAVMAEQCTGRGARGVVCAAAPLAAAAGADALRAGGNAYDAAVAAALAETVLLPSKCGLGGDLVAITAAPGLEPEALLAVGGAPRRARRSGGLGHVARRRPARRRPARRARRLRSARRARPTRPRRPRGTGDRAGRDRLPVGSGQRRPQPRRRRAGGRDAPRGVPLLPRRGTDRCRIRGHARRTRGRPARARRPRCRVPRGAGRRRDRARRA
jgi:hypothetical protein